MAKKIELLDGLTDGNSASIGLYFKAEGSDKEYHVHLKPEDTGWIVSFQYGKRGSALRDGRKTVLPITWQEAAEKYSKVVRDQLKDGYTPNSSGAAYQDTPLGERLSGITPMLLNIEGEESFLALADHPDWFYQEKFDGERLMIRKNMDGPIEGINKKGLLVSMPLEIVQAAQTLLAQQFIIDSEWLGSKCAVFDLIELNGVDLRSHGALKRKNTLDTLIATVNPENADAFIHVETATTSEEKHALYQRVETGGGEGVVGKRKNSPYESGRPNSGGAQLKRKFKESATLIAGAMHKTKRSLEVFGIDIEKDNLLVLLGMVTLPPNVDIPNKDALVEVEYLYAHRGGKLAQMVYKGVRLDQDREDASLAQLKYKREDNGPTPSANKMKI